MPVRNHKWTGMILCGLIGVAACVPWAHAASNLAFKVVVVNPSKDEAQTATVKSYLPREIKSGDIVSKGDLQAVYDDKEGAYFVYGEVELKPAEVWEQEVELRDVWSIPEEEIASLRAETAKYIQLLKDTEFAERVKFLCDSIDEKLVQIEQSQKLEPANPEQRIAAYRDNLKVLEGIRTQLADVRAMLAQARPFSMRAVWGMILAIVVFLAILGGTFYAVWFRQLRSSQIPGDFEAPSEQGGPKGPVTRQQGKRPQKDIDQVLGQ